MPAKKKKAVKIGVYILEAEHGGWKFTFFAPGNFTQGAEVYKSYATRVKALVAARHYVNAIRRPESVEIIEWL